ncbi:hypothetical protein [Klebsiella pneumoniae]|uniref:hypothetical protein n=1 Tax=Klebsiella pneumoniae TaxID=573 RepID=UPI0039764794
MKFGLFFVGEYIGIVTVSALIVTCSSAAGMARVTSFHLVRAENRVLHDDVHFDPRIITASAL